MPSCRRPCPSRWRATDMRRLVLLALFALIALTEACAVGPGYRRSSLGMPDGWRPRAASEDSLRPFYDSLRTSRDTLLPAGTDTARVPFTYDTTPLPPRPGADSGAALRWLDLIQDSVLRQLVATSLRENRDIRTADLNLAIARRTLESRRQTLALARRRLGQGLISELDVRQFEADVASPAASVADFERQVAQQENALSVLVGRNPGAIARGRALTEMAARIPVPAGVPSGLLANRPDVRSAEATLRAATARIGVAQAAWLPTFTITGQYGSQSTDWSKWFGSGTNVWQAFAGVSIPLFTEGRPGGGEQVNIARARAAQARSRYEQTVLVALREVEDALVGLRTAQDRSAAQERQAIALRRALELATMRYQNGVSSYLDVLDAQRGLFGAELALTQAERDQLVAAVQLYRAVGAGWPAAKQ